MSSTTDKPLNISTETWAFLLILVGCAMDIACHRMGINAEAGAGIIGAGTMAFTSSVKHDSIQNSPGSILVSPAAEDSSSKHP